MKGVWFVPKSTMECPFHLNNVCDCPCSKDRKCVKAKRLTTIWVWLNLAKKRKIFTENRYYSSMYHSSRFFREQEFSRTKDNMPWFLVGENNHASIEQSFCTYANITPTAIDHNSKYTTESTRKCSKLAFLRVFPGFEKDLLNREITTHVTSPIGDELARMYQP